jgi:hypothetical protein
VAKPGVDRATPNDHVLACDVLITRRASPPLTVCREATQRSGEAPVEAGAQDGTSTRSRKTTIDAAPPGGTIDASRPNVRTSGFAALAEGAVIQRSREAAEESFAHAPQNLDASRNLSLVYKQLGATLEMLKARPEAVKLYRQALDLDRRRAAAEPARPMWRLDLSFSLGALGAAQMAERRSRRGTCALRGGGRATRTGRE